MALGKAGGNGGARDGSGVNELRAHSLQIELCFTIHEAWQEQTRLTVFCLIGAVQHKIELV